MAGLWIVGRGLNAVRVNGYAFIWANLAFVALSLPLITLPAAWSALMRVSHDTFTEPSDADLSLFWQTFRENMGSASLWGLANLIFAWVNFSNLAAYSPDGNLLISGLRLAWLGMTFVWLGSLLYTWPLYYEMEVPHLLGATRNAILMTLYNPLFTLIILLCLVILAIISTILAAMWMLLTFGVIAAIGNAAVLDRLEQYRASHNQGN